MFWFQTELYSLFDHNGGQQNENCPPDDGIVTPGLSSSTYISEIADWVTDAHRGAAVVEEDVGC